MDHRLFVSIIKTIDAGGQTIDQGRMQGIGFPAPAEQRDVRRSGKATQRLIRRIDTVMPRATYCTRKNVEDRSECFLPHLGGQIAVPVPGGISSQVGCDGAFI